MRGPCSRENCWIPVSVLAAALWGLLWPSGLAARDRKADAEKTATAPTAEPEPTVWATSFLDATLNLEGACKALGLEYEGAQDGRRASCTEACVSGESGCPSGRRRVEIGACSAEDRHAGACLDPVVFQETIGTSKDADPSILSALWRNLSHLYLGLWSGLAPRWSREKDAVADAMAKAHTTAFPGSPTLWAGSAPARGDVFALPSPSRWLASGRWILGVDVTQGVTAPFRALRYRSSEGLEKFPPPHMVVMRGRFAERLAVGQERINADLMDADGETAEVFFRQIYPYESGSDQTSLQRTNCLESLRPLACFDRAAAHGEAFFFRPTASATSTEAEATRQFHRFAQVIGLRLLQQGRRDYLATHTRVLAALVAMSSPPSLARQGTIGATEALNNSLPGQSDSRTSPSSEEGTVAGGGDSRIDYGALPIEVVRELLAELALPPEDTTCVALSAGGGPDELVAILADRKLFVDHSLFRANRYLSDDEETELKRKLTALMNLPDERVWSKLLPDLLDERLAREPFDQLRLKRVVEGGCQEAALRAPTPTTAIAPATLAAEPAATGEPAAVLDQDAADAAFFRLSVEERRSQILVRHIESALVQRLSPSTATAPEDVEKAAEQAWTTTLALHGPLPQPGRPGLANVDPVAVCTTSASDADAAKEPVFKVVHLDVLFVDRADVEADLALWGARGTVPFLWIDDPSLNQPVVDRLAAMPGGRALYRARWEIWSGWHLLWGATPLGDGRSAVGLRLHTAAICEDTVLAPESLVPTVVRAGLLEGPMRAPQPLTRTELRALRRADGEASGAAPTNDDAVNAGITAGGAARDGVERGAMAAEQASEDPSAGLDRATSPGRPAASGDEPPDYAPPGGGVGARREALASSEYLRGLVLEGIRRVDDGPATLVVAFDTTLLSGRDPSWKARPRTPYLIRQARIPDAGWLRSAAWLLELHPSTSPTLSWTPVVPHYEPTGSDEPDALHLRWTRQPHTDFTLAGDLGVFPWRIETTDCEEARFQTGDAEGGDDQGDSYEGMVVSCDHADLLVEDLDADVGASSTPEATAGFTLGVTSLGTTWLIDVPRLAVEYGAEIQLDILPPGTPPAYLDNEVDYTWTTSPRFGVIGGLRFAPDPVWLSRRPGSSADRVRLPWGVAGGGARTHLGRSQWGARGGFALEPWSEDGLLYTVSADGWAAWSARRQRSPWASLTPYQPNAVWGPYVRWQYSALWGAPQSVYLSTLNRQQVLVGLRWQARLGGKVAIPEG